MKPPLLVVFENIQYLGKKEKRKERKKTRKSQCKGNENLYFASLYRYMYSGQSL
jgi:hypothetical protein